MNVEMFEEKFMEIYADLEVLYFALLMLDEDLNLSSVLLSVERVYNNVSKMRDYFD